MPAQSGMSSDSGTPNACRSVANDSTAYAPTRKSSALTIVRRGTMTPATTGAV